MHKKNTCKLVCIRAHTQTRLSVVSPAGARLLTRGFSERTSDCVWCLDNDLGEATATPSPHPSHAEAQNCFVDLNVEKKSRKMKVLQGMKIIALELLDVQIVAKLACLWSHFWTRRRKSHKGLHLQRAPFGNQSFALVHTCVLQSLNRSSELGTAAIS